MHGTSPVSSPEVPSYILEPFSSGEGISPCVPSSGPSVPPSPGCCSVGWSQHESYFWLSGYLILHNPQRFRPRSFHLVHERHCRDSDFPFPRAPPEIQSWGPGSCHIGRSGSPLQSPGRTFWVQLNFCNNPWENPPTISFPNILSIWVELQIQEVGCWDPPSPSNTFSPASSANLEVCELKILKRAHGGKDLFLSCGRSDKPTFQSQFCLIAQEIEWHSKFFHISSASP